MIRMDLLEENNQKAEDHFKPAVSGTFQIGVGRVPADNADNANDRVLRLGSAP